MELQGSETNGHVHVVWTTATGRENRASNGHSCVEALEEKEGVELWQGSLENYKIKKLRDGVEKTEAKVQSTAVV